ncbi:hypothetical protein R1sor_022013 [Riccia sorocarpa]|uniref:Uncharacterized protein n=1 Tax=Riccia sorocarpa TaxID=122646 RepID=A0ABD3GLM8_9MARC
MVKPEHAALVISSVILLRHIWRGRCKAVYDTNTSCVPLDITLQEAAKMVRTLQNKYKASAKLEDNIHNGKDGPLEYRRMSRSDADADRHPKERTTQEETLNDNRQSLENPTLEQLTAQQGRQWNMVRELSLLGFEEFNSSATCRDSPEE